MPPLVLLLDQQVPLVAFHGSCSNKQPCLGFMQKISTSLGPLPLVKERSDEDGEQGGDDAGSQAAAKPYQAAVGRPAVLADGSYATQTALADTFTPSISKDNPPNLRQVHVSP